MTLLYADSFDSWATIEGKWSRSYTAARFTAFDNVVSEGRRGTRCLAAKTNGSDSTAQHYFKLNYGSANPVIIGFAFKVTVNVWPYQDGYLALEFYDIANTTQQAWFVIKGGGVLQFHQPNGTLIKRFDGLFKHNIWHYMEVKIQFADSTTIPGYIKMDGKKIYDIPTGIDTKAGTVDVAAIRFRTFKTNNNSFWVDDLYVCDTLGSVHTGALGDLFVSTLFPTGNGIQNDFLGSDGTSTGNYQWIDDPIVNTGDYVESSTSGHIDLYRPSDINESTSIQALSVNSYIKKDDGGTKDYSPIVRLSGTNYFGDGTGLSTSYVQDKIIFSTNPVHSGSWTTNDINNIEIGLKVDN